MSGGPLSGIAAFSRWTVVLAVGSERVLASGPALVRLSWVRASFVLGRTTLLTYPLDS